MTTEDDFQATLDLNPEDWQARLILADFLDERGDPRAAGYRALGELQIRPLAFKMKSGPKAVVWGYHRGIGTNPNTGRTASFRHALPLPWFMAAGPHHDEDVWILFYGPIGRSRVERCAAYAFGHLTAEQQSGILAAGRSRLRCAAAMGV